MSDLSNEDRKKQLRRERNKRYTDKLKQRKEEEARQLFQVDEVSEHTGSDDTIVIHESVEQQEPPRTNKIELTLEELDEYVRRMSAFKEDTKSQLEEPISKQHQSKKEDETPNTESPFLTVAGDVCKGVLVSTAQVALQTLIPVGIAMMISGSSMGTTSTSNTNARSYTTQQRTPGVTQDVF